jgi:type IV fimbrial biogenesis protein FimT
MTLPELLVVMAVFAVAITSIGPSLYGVMEDNRVASYSDILRKDLKLARHEAIMRGYRVVICPIQDNDTSACSDTKDWSSGWMVFADADETRSPTNQATDLIRVQDALPTSVTVTSSLGLGDTNIIYKPDGSSHVAGHFDVISTNKSTQARGREIKWDVFRNPTITLIHQ